MAAAAWVSEMASWLTRKSPPSLSNTTPVVPAVMLPPSSSTVIGPTDPFSARCKMTKSLVKFYANTRVVRECRTKHKTRPRTVAVRSVRYTILRTSHTQSRKVAVAVVDAKAAIDIEVSSFLRLLDPKPENVNPTKLTRSIKYPGIKLSNNTTCCVPPDMTQRLLVALPAEMPHRNTALLSRGCSGSVSVLKSVLAHSTYSYMSKGTPPF